MKKILHTSLFGVLILLKYVILFLPCLNSSSRAHTLSHLLNNEFFNKYNRPITVLYISQDPELFSLSQEDVIIFWTKASLKDTFQSKNYGNYILLNGAISLPNMICLAQCEHFDIAIIDFECDFSAVQRNVHLADHTIFLTEHNVASLVKIGEIDHKNVFLKSQPKTILEKNWWCSISDHKNYNVISNFDEKYLIKPKEYVYDDKKEKKYVWIPGINLRTFFSLGGSYPTKKYLREKVLEIFDPKVCRDFGVGNIILQGLRLRAIDFDTTHPEDPYERLKRTIERQMRMKYM